MSDNIIGRVLATEKAPTTIDNFAFWTDPLLVLHPFDVVKVQHVDGSFSYGVIEDIAHITDAASFLTSYISSDFGDVNAQGQTMRVGMNYVSAKVVCNDKNIYIPLQNDAQVMLATADEINYALGLNEIQNPLMCGYIEMYENTQTKKNKITLPVPLNSKFIIGPEGAHLNISGISGLASKTSYAMFLMKSIQDQYLKREDENDDSVAFVLFNVKGRDLLAIDQMNDFADSENPQKKKEDVFTQYEQLHLTPEPFKNVQYYFPYSPMSQRSGWNTYMGQDAVSEAIKLKKAHMYKYIYEYDKDNLDLMFANIEDSTQTMDAIVSYVMAGQGGFNEVDNWDEFLNLVKEKCSTQSVRKTDKEIPVASWRKFYRIVNKSIRGNSIFASTIKAQNNEVRLGDSLRYIKKNEVHVIDIAKLSEDKQGYVFGDVMRTIYDLQLGQFNDDNDVKPPAKIVIFIDELNKYASKDTPKNSPVLRQILDIAERGRSLGVVLFAAEQFRSAIHDRVAGNCSTHAYGRTNAIEITKGSDYRAMPEVYKNMLTRMKQGEYLIQNPVFRSLLKIKFPEPIYKQFK